MLRKLKLVGVSAAVVALVITAAGCESKPPSSGPARDNTPSLPPKPKPELISWTKVYNTFGPDDAVATVKNSGAAGTVRCIVKADGDKSWEYTALFKAGEERVVVFELPGASSDKGVRYQMWVQGE